MRRTDPLVLAGRHGDRLRVRDGHPGGQPDLVPHRAVERSARLHHRRSDDICEAQSGDDFVAGGESGQELCDLSNNSGVVEDYVLYAGFSTTGPATTYFGALLSGNGMKEGQGDCSTLSWRPPPTAVPVLPGRLHHQGRERLDLVFTGSNDFNLGNGTLVSGLDECLGSTTVDVVAFTDPGYTAVGVALDCEGGEYQAVDEDFTSGDFFLGG